MALLRTRWASALVLLTFLALAPGAHGASLVDVRVAEHTGYDRLVLELSGDAAANLLFAPVIGSGSFVLEIEADPGRHAHAFGFDGSRLGRVAVQRTQSGARIIAEARSSRIRAFRLSQPARVVIDFGDPLPGPFPIPGDGVALSSGAARVARALEPDPPTPRFEPGTEGRDPFDTPESSRPRAAKPAPVASTAATASTAPVVSTAAAASTAPVVSTAAAASTAPVASTAPPMGAPTNRDHVAAAQSEGEWLARRPRTGVEQVDPAIASDEDLAPSETEVDPAPPTRRPAATRPAPDVEPRQPLAPEPSLAPTAERSDASPDTPHDGGITESASAPEPQLADSAPESDPGPRATSTDSEGVAPEAIGMLAIFGLALIGVLAFGWVRRRSPAPGESNLPLADVLPEPEDEVLDGSPEVITARELSDPGARAELLEKRLDQEVRARLHLEAKLGELQAEYKILRDRLHRVQPREGGA